MTDWLGRAPKHFTIIKIFQKQRDEHESTKMHMLYEIIEIKNQRLGFGRAVASTK